MGLQRQRILDRFMTEWKIAAVLLTVMPAAQSQTAKADRPDVYTVRKGDTLWDISGRFLNEPWLWPEIWQANPQIENPHLIYPGDEVSLVFVGGEPRLRLARGARPTIKLSRAVRVSRRGRAGIRRIPLAAIAEWLSRPRVVSEGRLEGAPYVVSVGKEHLVAGGQRRLEVAQDGVDARRGVLHHHDVRRLGLDQLDLHDVGALPQRARRRWRSWRRCCAPTRTAPGRRTTSVSYTHRTLPTKA